MGALKLVILHEAIEVLGEAVDVDNELWELRACGQDTEQAEMSASLAGYHAGLEAAKALIFDDDPKLLRDFVEMARRDTIEARKEIEEVHGESDHRAE